MTQPRRLDVKTKRRVWTLLFLGVFTLGAIVMEVLAGVFHVASTIPWTEYLARYVPWPVQLAAYVFLVFWLPIHFWRHDHLKKVHYQRGFADGVRGQRALSKRLAENPLPSSRSHPGEPRCSHGYVFGRWQAHHCDELPSDAVRFAPGRSDGR